VSIAAPGPKRGAGIIALAHPLVVILVKLVWLDQGNNVGHDVSWHYLHGERKNNSPKRDLVLVPPLLCSWDSRSVQCLQLPHAPPQGSKGEGENYRSISSKEQFITV